MASRSRTTYEAGTPNLSTFNSASLSREALSPTLQSPSEPFLTPILKPQTVARSRVPLPVPSGVKNVFRRTQETLANNTGMLLIAASQAFFSLMNVAVKKLNSLDEPVPPFELILVRMGITWICCVSYMFIMKVPDPFLGPKGVRLLLVTRGFVGFFGLFGVYYSLQYLSLSDATVLTFLAPMCTVFTGAIFLKEGFAIREALAGLCALVGVILIARPESIFGRAAHDDIPLNHPVEGVDLDLHMGPVVTPAQRVGAVGVALLGVLGATGAYTTIRAIGKRAHPLHNLVSFSSQCVIVSTIAIFVTHTQIIIPTRLSWLLMLLMIGIFGFIAQVLLTMGLQRETAGRGTMAVYVQIIFATAFEKIFFHSSPSPLSILGTVIIMTAAVYVAVTKQKAAPKTTSGNAEDISLEEGLLSHQNGREDDDEDDLGSSASTTSVTTDDTIVENEEKTKGDVDVDVKTVGEERKH